MAFVAVGTGYDATHHSLPTGCNECAPHHSRFHLQIGWMILFTTSWWMELVMMKVYSTKPSPFVPPHLLFFSNPMTLTSSNPSALATWSTTQLASDTSQLWSEAQHSRLVFSTGCLVKYHPTGCVELRATQLLKIKWFSKPAAMRIL